MKKLLATLLILFFLQNVSGFTLLEEEEDFEDDTPGANPTDPRYTFLESTAGAAFVSNSDAFSGTQSLFINTEGDGAAMNFGTNQDWCGDDSVVSHWFKAIDTGGSAVSAFFVLTDGEPVGNFDDDSDVPLPAIGMQYFHNRLGSVYFEDGGTKNNGPSGQNALSITEQWYQAVITRDGDCDGSVPFTLEIYDSSETLLLSESDTCSPCNFGSEVSTLIWIDAFDGGSGSPDTFVDDVKTVSRLIPEAPTGAAATVTNNEVNPDEYNVRFTLSPDDTDQTNADYTYSLYYDSGSGTTLYDTYPAGVAVDGIIADQVFISTTGSITFWATATDPLTGFEGEDSCTVTVDSTTLLDSDACGTTIPGEEQTGSDLTGAQGGLFGGDKAGLAAALQISEAALEIVIGLMLLMLLIAGGWFAYGIVGAAGLGTIGLILNYALGLFPFWTIYVIGFIGTAIAILLVKVMRR